MKTIINTVKDREKSLLPQNQNSRLFLKEGEKEKTRIRSSQTSKVQRRTKHFFYFKNYILE